jgi:hypothetical protein
MVGEPMIGKIVRAVKEAISPAKPPRPPIEYHDQKPWTVKHSSLEAQQPQDDGWLSANGRYNLKNWVNRR